MMIKYPQFGQLIKLMNPDDVGFFHVAFSFGLVECGGAHTEKDH